MAEAAEPAKPIRRRQRPGLSCLECRRRKVKCNQARPCDQCTRGRRPGCSYGPRNSTSVVSTLPWALGKPESFGPSSEALRETLRESSTTVSGGVSTQAPRRSSVEGSKLEVQAVALQPQPPSYPTPTTSSEGKFNANSEITSVSGNVSAAETPGSGSHPSPWIGSDKRSQSVTKPTETAERTTEKRGSIYELQSSDSASFVRSKLPGESRVSAVGDPITRPQRGLFSKTRLFGPSHWMCFFDQFERIYSFSNQGDGKTNGECSVAEIQDINDALNKCKDLARYVKGQQADHQPLSGKLLEASLPCRELCDNLVQLYINGFEPVCRILHIPSFEREYLRYWQSPDTVNKAFIYQLVLVLCIGASISQDPGVTFQSSARQWISAAQSWLSGPFEKSRLNIHSLQIHCLLLLARQVTAVESDLAWISTGTLLRTAMQMGFHHDPEYLPRMSPLNIELRRRLWATIMEMAVQSSLESGQPPLISFDDFNTKPPLNINDSEIDESTQILPRSKDQTVFTDTSLQLALLQSLRIRHDIASAINNVRSGPTYDEILKLDGRMMDAWRECGRLMQIFSRYPATPGASITITAFHRNLMEWMLRSYLLIMHRLPAVQASKDPKFYFSRKACLAAAFGLTSPEPDDQFRRLMTVGAGFIRSVFVHSGTVLCLELITQVEEDSANMALQRNAAMREPLRRAVHDMASHAQKRVEVGENNVRGHMFYSMVIGQVEAIEAGTSQDRGILKGARNAVRISWNLLKAREQMSTPASAQFDVGNPLNGVSAPPAEGLHGGVVPNGDVNFQDPGFAFENIEIPESWLFTDWDLFGD